jgi:hypothetical protein
MPNSKTGHAFDGLIDGQIGQIFSIFPYFYYFWALAWTN